MEEIQRALTELLARSEADECLLCDSGGYILAHEGAERQDLFSISALSAGVFTASRELARMLGEKEFDTIFHQGENKSIFIRAVNAEILLVVILSSMASVGLVKLYSTPAAATLQILFEAIKRHNKEVPSADHRSFVLRDEPLFTAKQV